MEMAQWVGCFQASMKTCFWTPRTLMELDGCASPVSVIPTLLWADGRHRQKDLWIPVVQVLCGCSNEQQEMLSQGEWKQMWVLRLSCNLHTHHTHACPNHTHMHRGKHNDNKGGPLQCVREARICQYYRTLGWGSGD